MRDLTELNHYRIAGLAQPRYEGAFLIETSAGDLRIIACCGEGWDHVSVSLEHRCPTWEEMERVKRLFFRDNEVAYQLHMPPARHINNHPHCLHLWRPHRLPIPQPPEWMV